MGRKKVKSLVKDDTPIVEEVFKAYGISVDSINGHSTKVGQASNVGVNEASPLKVKSTAVDVVEGKESQAEEGPDGQSAESGHKKSKDDRLGIPGCSRDSHEEARIPLKAVGHPLAQEAATSNVIASPSVSRTLGENDTASDNSLVKEVGSNLAQKGESAAKAPWIDLFKENRNPSKGLSLQFMENLLEVPKLKQEHVLDVYSAWGYSLVGYFAGRFPSKSTLLKLCDSWNIKYKYFSHSG